MGVKEARMNVYRQELKIRSTDVDMYQRLRPSVLFALFQEAAIAHVEELGVGRDKTLERGLLWIVTLQSVQIDRMPRYGEDVVLSTWPGEFMHIIFPRYFSLETADGEPLLKASALWSLIDAESRKLVFPEKYGLRLDGEKTGEEIPLPTAIKNIACTESREFIVPYSYIDLNGHMSNIKYLDIAEDCIAGQTDGLKLRAIRVEYAKETRLGESLTVSWGREGNSFFFVGRSNDKNFRLRLEYEPQAGDLL